MLNIYHYREEVEFSPGEPAPYAQKDVVVYLVGTTTPAPIYSDADLVTPIANSRIRTNEDSAIDFYSSQATVDVVRIQGGARSTVTGDPGAVDEMRYTRAMFLRR